MYLPRSVRIVHSSINWNMENMERLHMPMDAEWRQRASFFFFFFDKVDTSNCALSPQ